MDLTNVTFKMLVVEAYELTDDRVTGGPGWIKSDSFDVVAEAAPASTIDGLRKMLLMLLADRFKLVIHHEEKVMPAYVLLVGKKGTKLQPAADPNGKFQCKPGEGVKEQIHLVCLNATMANLGDLVTRLTGGAGGYVDAPVVDMTEIKGAYDVQLDWMSRGSYNTAMAKSDNGSDTDPLAVSMFDCVEKLGLKLESRKHSLDTIVIDSVERVPAAN